jgi:peroxiredoxin
MRALLPLLLSTALAAHGAPACPAVGDQAPRFSLPLARGGRISLGDLLVPKKPVLITFWRFDCAPCTRELPELEKLSAKWGLNVSVVVVHIAGPEEKMLAFLQNAHLTLRTAVDGSEKVSDRYCAQQLPQMALVDGGGILRNRWTGEQKLLTATLEAALAALPRPVVATR